MEKIYNYLEIKGIDIDTQEYKDNLFLHSLFGINEDGNIYKWDEKKIGLPKPSKKDLNEIKETAEDKKNRKQKKDLKEKLRDFKRNKIAVLSREEVLNILDELQVGHAFICKNRLYIIVSSPNSNNDVFASFPNDITKDFDIKTNSSNFAMG